MGPGESLIGDAMKDPGPDTSKLAGDELRGPIRSIPEMCFSE